MWVVVEVMVMDMDMRIFEDLELEMDSEECMAMDLETCLRGQEFRSQVAVAHPSFFDCVVHVLEFLQPAFFIGFWFRPSTPFLF